MKERINTNPEIITISCSRNKYFPNNRLPVLLYRNAIDLPDQKNKAAAILQKIFLNHGWSNTWKNGVYTFHHYHSNTHESLGISSGNLTLILGGPGGRKIKIKKGDLLILPAGVGHKSLSASEDFLCVGAYPQGKEYDINLGRPGELKAAIARIKKMSVPKQDPLFGREGFIKVYWK